MNREVCRNCHCPVKQDGAGKWQHVIDVGTGMNFCGGIIPEYCGGDGQPLRSLDGVALDDLKMAMPANGGVVTWDEESR